MTAPNLYRVPNTDRRIYAIEEHGDIRWTKFAEDHANIVNLKRSTKQEFEVMRSNEGYEDDVNTVFTVVGDNITLKG
jgi:aminoglycoside N3'-acetyltransferase